MSVQLRSETSSSSSSGAVTVGSLLSELRGKTLSLAETDPETVQAMGDLFAATPGFVFEQTISDRSCSTTPDFVSGTITNSCMNATDISIYAYCSGGNAVFQYYNTTNCAVGSMYRSEKATLGCFRSHLTGETVIHSSGCTTSTSPLPLTSSYYSVEQYYDGSDSTCSGQVMKFDANINNKCINDAQSGVSYLYNFPSRTTYSALDCVGQGTYDANYISTTCQASSKSIGVLVQGMNPTPRPTTSYQAATYSSGDGNNSMSLGIVAAIAIAISAFVGVVFLLGFFFATKASRRSASVEGNEMGKI